MIRLLMEDVTLIKTTDGLTAHLRFRGGATTTLTLARALNAWQLRETITEIVALIDQLLDQHTDDGVANMLRAGMSRAPDSRFTAASCSTSDTSTSFDPDMRDSE